MPASFPVGKLLRVCRGLRAGLGASLLLLATGLAAAAEDAGKPAPPKPPPYPNNLAPLVQTKYVKLPLGAVMPRGWLKDELQVQADGLTGHLHEVWDVARNSAWKGDAEKNVTPECCSARFVPRWLEGLVPLAHLLGDAKLKQVAAGYMDYLLTVENPASVTPSATGWAHLGRILPDYYDITHDERTVALGRRILDYADSIKDLKEGGANVPLRQGMFLGFGWWVYNKSGDKAVPDLVARISKNCVEHYTDYFTNFELRDKTAHPTYPVLPHDRGMHGVDVAQAVMYPVMFSLKERDPKYQMSVYKGMASLDKYDGSTGGRWNGDEWLAGNSPTQGTELCDVTELVFSLVKNFEAIGDVTFADRLEQLLFNALPATCTADMWAHQYDQQANQVLVSDAKRPWHGNTDTANVFGFTPHFPCCLSNLHSPFPRYIQNMWMHTADGGLVAAGYGPCEVKALVAGGTEVTVTEDTDYPFSDTITFRVNAGQPVRFPFYLRIPAWSDRAEITIGGRKTELPPQAGTMMKLEQVWQPGEVISLTFNSRLRAETRRNNAVSIAWGPLYFGLRIGESFKKITIKRDRPVDPMPPGGVADWEITPTTPWNYVLAIDRANPTGTMVRNRLSSVPFAQKGEPVWNRSRGDFVPWAEDAPLVLTMKARLVPAWRMNGANAGPVPASPVATDSPETTVELVPYGSTRLRIAEFPTSK